MIAKINQKKSPAQTKQAVCSSKSVSPCCAKKISLDTNTLSEYIQKRAYYLWEEAGKPANQELAIWIKAEQEILEQTSNKK